MNVRSVCYPGALLLPDWHANSFWKRKNDGCLLFVRVYVRLPEHVRWC